MKKKKIQIGEFDISSMSTGRLIFDTVSVCVLMMMVLCSIVRVFG